MTTQRFETKRSVPEVTAELAAVLERPANAHVIYETWEWVRVYPDPMGFLAHRQNGFLEKRLVSSRRADFQPLTGRPPVVIL